MSAQGLTASVSLKTDNMIEHGKRDFDGVEIDRSKRNPSSMSPSARDAAAHVNRDLNTDIAARGENGLKKRDYKKYTENSRYTKGGRQVKVSPTQNCNSNANCSIQIISSVTTGYSISVSLGFYILE